MVSTPAGFLSFHDLGARRGARWESSRWLSGRFHLRGESVQGAGAAVVKGMRSGLVGAMLPQPWRRIALYSDQREESFSLEQLSDPSGKFDFAEVLPI